jgi:hypothetical protein
MPAFPTCEFQRKLGCIDAAARPNFCLLLAAVCLLFYGIGLESTVEINSLRPSSELL